MNLNSRDAIELCLRVAKMANVLGVPRNAPKIPKARGTSSAMVRAMQGGQTPLESKLRAEDANRDTGAQP